MGWKPCHLVLDRAGRRLLVANGSGSLAVFPVSAEGRLGEATDVAKLPEVPADPARKTWSRASGVTLDAGQRFVFVCDPAALIGSGATGSTAASWSRARRRSSR